MKTIIQVYTNSYINSGINEFHGIGDFIRSTLGMYNLSKIFHFNLIVDFSLHPINIFLEKNEHIYSNIIEENKNNIQLIIHEYNILNFIQESNEEVLIFYGWFDLGVYNTPMTQESEIFMKNILIPNDIMKSYIEKKRREIPFNIYNIIHYRLGDDELVDKITTNFSLDHIKKK